MKLLFGFMTLFASSAFAAPSDYTKAIDALQLIQNGEYANGCTLTLTTSADGSRLQLQDGARILTATLTQQNVKQLSAQDENDGSYQYTFQVGTDSVLQLTHADDAYDRTDLTQKGQTISCENDY